MGFNRWLVRLEGVRSPRARRARARARAALGLGGVCACGDASTSRRSMGRGAVCRSDGATVEDFRSVRPVRGAVRIVHLYCSAVPGDVQATLRARCARSVDLDLRHPWQTSDWVWFEDGLAYDNARLPGADHDRLGQQVVALAREAANL